MLRRATIRDAVGEDASAVRTDEVCFAAGPNEAPWEATTVKRLSLMPPALAISFI
jgi:hypothetical protein